MAKVSTTTTMMLMLYRWPMKMGNQPALVALLRVPRLEAEPRMMLVMQATMEVAT